MKVEIIKLLDKAVKAEASDLHLTVGAPPFLRIHGDIILMDKEPLTPDVNKELIYSLLNEMQIEKLENDLELCFSRTIPNLGYFRINIYYQRGMVETAIRIGMAELKTYEDLRLPEALMELTKRPRGLILVTGPTGQGKTTTFNSLIDYINRDRRCKIITIEDPVEYLHKNIHSIVVQQELYTDTQSLHRGVIHILRQDPDIIGIGEMRDLETISAAITAAETGHLVIATLHTNNCAQTINRIVDVFPSAQQEQIRIQLSTSLLGIINQQLLAEVDKKGRILAYELMISNDAIRNLIRENKLQQIYNVIKTGAIRGMKTMDDCVKDYYEQGLITYDTAISHVSDPVRVNLLSKEQKNHSPL